MAGKYCGLFLHLVLLSITKGSAVPMSQDEMICPPRETLRLDLMATLELDCSSTCSGSRSSSNFEWLRSTGSEDVFVKETKGSRMVVASVDYPDGGTYKCRCLPDGPQCKQTVHIASTMDFTTTEKHLYSGEPLDLICTVHMTSPNSSTILNAAGAVLSRETYFPDKHTAVTSVVLKKQANIKEEYVCVMESYQGKELVERLQETITIYSYSPPEILYTTEFKVVSEDGFGQNGQLSCTVLTTLDTTATVTWFFKGEKLVMDQGKYSSNVLGTDESDVLKHVLLVKNVQPEDLGAYHCKLNSEFGQEDEHEVWITLTDTSRNSDTLRTAAGGDKTLYYSVVLLVGVAVCALGVWQTCGPSKSFKRWIRGTGNTRKHI